MVQDMIAGWLWFSDRKSEYLCLFALQSHDRKLWTDLDHRKMLKGFLPFFSRDHLALNMIGSPIQGAIKVYNKFREEGRSSKSSDFFFGKLGPEKTFKMPEHLAS